MRMMVERMMVAIRLITIVFVATVLSQCTQGQEAANGRLKRAPEALQLETHLLENKDLGPCHAHKSLLPMVVSDAHCVPLKCLQGETMLVDMHSNPLEEYRGDPNDCIAPSGGQLPLSSNDDQPEVSFIIPYYNHEEETSSTLLEVFRIAREAASAEYILVSDASDNEAFVVDTAQKLQRLFGIHIVHLRTNVTSGFGAAVNLGNSIARGRYRAILNNDAYVMQGWLAVLLATIKETPLRGSLSTHSRPTGMVGPMFVGRDNLVQEAGGWMYQDATRGNFWHNQNIAPEANYRREVDYISTAAVLLDPFALGGAPIFDAAYKGGYYEDTDLAFRLTANGYRVIYQPFAVVYHQEGTTYGTDASERKQQLMAHNREVFVERWQSSLQHHCPSSVSNSVAAARKMGTRVLWVDKKTLEPDRDSGSLRTYNILRILQAEGYRVAYQAIVPWMHDGSDFYKAAMRYDGFEILPVQKPEDWDMQDENDRCKYDAIVAARRDILQPSIETIKKQCSCVPLIYDTVDLHFLREARDMLTHSSGMDWAFNMVNHTHVVTWIDDQPKATKKGSNNIIPSRNVELTLMDSSDVVVVVSDVEEQVIKHYRPDATVVVVSNTHDLDQASATPFSKPCEERHGLLFVGSSSHGPNKQAVMVLLKQILPSVLGKLPIEMLDTFKIHLVGSGLPSDIKDDLSKYVKTHGYLSEDDIKAIFNSSKVFAAPLLSGAGVKGKVNQAMKYGLPIVGTPIAFEAMHAQSGVDCMSATSVEEFVDAVVQVYTDCELWKKLSEGGLANVQRNFGLDTARGRVFEMLRHVNIAPPTVLGTCTDYVDACKDARQEQPVGEWTPDHASTAAPYVIP